MLINPYSGEKLSSKLCIYSYNSRGFSLEKQTICSKLFDNSGDSLPILCNQENFLYKSTSYKVKQALPNAFVFFKEAYKIHGEASGRPQNGMFIAIDKSLKNFASNISSQNWRVQAIKISLDMTNLVIINTYFPGDPQTLNFDDTVLHDMLSS